MSSLIIKLWHTNFMCDGYFCRENGFTQIDSCSTIDGNVEFVHFVSDKSISNSDLRIKCLSYNKSSAILC